MGRPNQHNQKGNPFSLHGVIILEGIGTENFGGWSQVKWMGIENRNRLISLHYIPGFWEGEHIDKTDMITTCDLMPPYISLTASEYRSSNEWWNVPDEIASCFWYLSVNEKDFTVWSKSRFRRLRWTSTVMRSFRSSPKKHNLGKGLLWWTGFVSHIRWSSDSRTQLQQSRGDQSDQELTCFSFRENGSLCREDRQYWDVSIKARQSQAISITSSLQKKLISDLPGS
jgi:hypothetical protein